MPPPRRSLAGWALLSVLLVVCSYAVTVVLAAACVYLPFLMLQWPGSVATGLALLLGGSLIAAAMLRSLVPRRDDFRVSGPRLDPEKQPRLFAEISAIAAAFREPMPADVYLVPLAAASVGERGGRMGFGNRRVLILGLPLLSLLTVSQFRAVLAHEFGHYYAGDTALLPWVFRTRETMLRTVKSLVSGTGSMKLLRFNTLGLLLRNVVLSALEQYWRLFLRGTLAVARRQEFRADELACWLSGSQALIDGICIHARASAAGPPFWQNELTSVLRFGLHPPLAQGFALFLASPAIAKTAADSLHAQIARTVAGPLDTHPPLSARFAAARALPYPAPPEDAAGAITLLADLETLEVELLEAAFPSAKKREWRNVSWEQAGILIHSAQWSVIAVAHGELLAGITAERLPEAVRNLREMGSRIRDPKGMLLTNPQRTERAASLLATSLAVALMHQHWVLHSQPGDFYLSRDGFSLKPVEIVSDLQSGRLTAADWQTQCESAGISGLRLDGLAAAGAG